MAKNATVAVKFTGDVADLKRATGEAERELESFGSRIGPKLKTAMAGAGLAAGAVVVDSFFTGMDQQNTTARLGASLGLSDEEAKRLGKTAGEIYTEGWGESFDAVSDALETVVSTLGEELDPADVEAVTTKAIALADIFQLDVAEAVSTVGFMIRNDLVRDATEGFDIITAGLQKLPEQMRGEALEALNEYAVSFGALGYDGSEAMALIIDAAQNTSVGVDKVGDAVKEFLIRATDGSASTRDALQWLKLDAEAIATAIASGGPAAETAFQQIVDALLKVEDPAYRAQLAVALFGTPIEDLAVTQIPEFLTALQNAEGGLGDVEGAADDATDAMNTNQAAVEAWKRKMQQAVVDYIAESVIPALNDLDENWGLTMQLVGFYTEAAAGRVVDALDFMAGGFTGPLKGAADLLSILQEISGLGPDDVADALGVDRNDELSDYLAGIAPKSGKPTNAGSDFVPGTRIPLRAKGGPVGTGSPYIVGEEGPELFVPGASGTIIPNDATSGLLDGSRAAQHYNIEIHNHYPKPETATDGTLRALRKIRGAM